MITQVEIVEQLRNLANEIEQMPIACESISPTVTTQCTTVFDCERSQASVKYYLLSDTTTEVFEPLDCSQTHRVTLEWVGCDGLRVEGNTIGLEDSVGDNVAFQFNTGITNHYNWDVPAENATLSWGNQLDVDAGEPLCSVFVEVECEAVEHEPLNFAFEGHGGEAVNYDLDQVYAVTNLNESGAGSLQAAPSNAYVIFPNISGTGNWGNAQTFQQNNWWVLGQTSPSGVQFRGGDNADHEGLVDIEGDSHIWQYVRIRPDAPTNTGGSNCCHKPFLFKQMNGGVIDHCSTAWGDDDCLGSFESQNITISNCIMSQGLVTDADSARGTYSLRTTGLTVTRNLMIHQSTRSPGIGDCPLFDAYNNVAYNCIRDVELFDQGTAMDGNFECNVEIKGSDSSSFWQDHVVGGSSALLTVYVNDNKVLQNAQQDCASAPEPDWVDGTGSTASNDFFSSTAFDCPRLEKLAVCDVLDYVLQNAGASNNRDSFDALMVQDVTAGSGGLVSAPGPWPTMTGGNTKNPWDSSKADYLSDAIKQECGLDPATHANTTQTNTNGGTRNDFLYIIDYCFGL